MDYTAPSFAPLAGLRRLRRLVVVHFPHVTSLDPLADLTGLEELTLETLPGGDASGRTKTVDSFRPLAALTGLRLLKLAGVVCADGVLSPLGRLTGLRTLALGNVFAQGELARLARRLPQAGCPFLAPFVRLDGHACGRYGDSKVMLSGADLPRPRVICPTCQARRLAETARRFNALADA